MANQLVYIHIENIGYLCQCLQVELCVVHHFDTVAGSLCNVFANHLLIIPLSANTVLTRFKSAMLQLFVVFAVKLLLLTGNKDYIHIKLPKRVLFSQIQGI